MINKSGLKLANAITSCLRAYAPDLDTIGRLKTENPMLYALITELNQTIAQWAKDEISRLGNRPFKEIKK
ncbi:hypothetical protein J7K43_07685 [Candidatus Calescamantes bacterium]|nr:hypothetical protein [Candidatus Calescamantes bacterium]